jgi:hypothetical protein
MDRSDAEPSPSEVYLRVPGPQETVSRVGPTDIPETPVRVPSMLLVVALVATIAALVQAWPQAAAYRGVMEENLALREQLSAMDSRMGEVETMMLRLQLYDAQLRSLSQAAGDHGPLPDDAMQGYAVADGDDTDAADTDAQEAESTAAEEPGPEIELVDAELLPARAWAAAVSQRMEDALDRFELGEADLNALMAELEGLRAVRDALPGLWPAEGRFTSGFGWRRDPVRGTTKFHSGIDIANDRGTAIYSVAPGTVTRAGTSSGYGRVVEIDHGFGVSTKYAHCTTLRVREGERVERGDYIATMGSTGKSTGPHLHFELRIDGNAVDPLKYLPR